MRLSLAPTFKLDLRVVLDGEEVGRAGLQHLIDAIEQESQAAQKLIPELAALSVRTDLVSV